MAGEIADLGFDVDTGSLERAARLLDDLRAAGERVGEGARAAGAGLDQGMRTASTGGLATASGAVGGLASQLGKVAGIVAGGIGFADMLGTARDFAGAMNGLQEKLNLSGEAMLEVRDYALEMGSSTAFSASEAAGAMDALASRGADAAEAMDMLPAVLDLATSSSLSLEDAARITKGTLNQFALDVEDTVRVVDTLAGAADSSGTNVTQLADGLEKAGPFARSLGISLEETTAMIGVLADNSIVGPEAGTGLVAMLSRLTNASGDGKDALEELGLSSEDFLKTLDDGREVSIGFADSIDLLESRAPTATQRMRVLGQEAGKTVVPAFLEGGDAVRAMAESIEAASSAAEQAKTMAQGLPGAYTALGSAWEGVQLAFMDLGGTDAAEGAIRLVAEGLRTLTTDVLGPMKGTVAEVRQWFVDLGAALDDSGTRAGEQQGRYDGMVGVLRDLVGVVRPLVPYVEDFGLALLAVGGTAAAIGLVGAALTLIGGVVLSPVVLGIAAIAGAAVVIRANWDGLAAWWAGLWGEMDGETSDAWASIEGSARGGLAAIGQAIETANLGGGFARLWADVRAGLGVALGQMILSVKGAMPGIAAAFAVMSTDLAALVPELVATFETLYPKLRAAAVLGWQTVTDVVGLAWDAIGLAVELGWGVLTGFLAAGLRVLRGDFSGAWDQIVETVEEFGTDLLAGLAALQQSMAGAAERLGNAIVEALTAPLTDGLAGVKNALQDTFDFLPFIGPRAERDARTVGELVPETFATSISRNKPLVSSAVEEIGEDMSAVARAWVPSLFAAGEDTAGGYASGIREGAARVVAASEDMAHLPEDVTRDITDTHSDSKVMIGVGHDITGGLATGIAEGGSDVADNVRRIADAIAPEFERAVVRALASADSVREAFGNLGDYLRGWLKGMAAEFAATTLMVSLGMKEIPGAGGTGLGGIVNLLGLNGPDKAPAAATNGLLPGGGVTSGAPAAVGALDGVAGALAGIPAPALLAVGAVGMFVTAMNDTGPSLGQRTVNEILRGRELRVAMIDTFGGIGADLRSSIEALGGNVTGGMLSSWRGWVNLALRNIDGGTTDEQFAAMLGNVVRGSASAAFDAQAPEMQRIWSAYLDIAEGTSEEILEGFKTMAEDARGVMPLLSAAGLDVDTALSAATRSALGLGLEMGGADAAMAGLRTALGLFFSAAEINAQNVGVAQRAVEGMNAELGLFGPRMIDTADEWRREWDRVVNDTSAAGDAYRADLLRLGEPLGVLVAERERLGQLQEENMRREVETARLAQEAHAQALADARAEWERQVGIADGVAEAFRGLGLRLDPTAPKAIETANALAELFGGLDKLTAATRGYYQSFYSEIEQSALANARAAAEVLAWNDSLVLTAAQLANVTGGTIDTREEFRAYVESLDLQTAAGRRAYFAALELQGSMLTVADAEGTLREMIASLPPELRGAFNLMTEDARASGDAMVASGLDARVRLTEELGGIVDAAGVKGQAMRLALGEHLGAMADETDRNSESARARAFARLSSMASETDAHGEDMRGSMHTHTIAMAKQVWASSLAMEYDMSRATGSMKDSMGAAMGTLASSVHGAAAAAQSAAGTIRAAFGGLAGSVSASLASIRVPQIGGSFATGLERVPYNGFIAETHQDEMIVTARGSAQLRAMGFGPDGFEGGARLPVASALASLALSRAPGAGQDTGALVAELRAVRAELVELRRESDARASVAEAQRGAQGALAAEQTAVLEGTRRDSQRLGRSLARRAPA